MNWRILYQVSKQADNSEYKSAETLELIKNTKYDIIIIDIEVVV